MFPEQLRCPTHLKGGWLVAEVSRFSMIHTVLDKVKKKKERYDVQTNNVIMIITTKAISQ